MGLWDNTVDNEGSDICTEDEIKDWDSTLNDGLEELEEEEFDKSNFSQIEEKIYSLEQQLIPGLSAFRSNKIRSEINKLKSYLPPPKNDDLVKTY